MYVAVAEYLMLSFVLFLGTNRSSETPAAAHLYMLLFLLFCMEPDFCPPQTSAEGGGAQPSLTEDVWELMWKDWLKRDKGQGWGLRLQSTRLVFVHAPVCICGWVCACTHAWQMTNPNAVRMLCYSHASVNVTHPVCVLLIDWWEPWVHWHDIRLCLSLPCHFPHCRLHTHPALCAFHRFFLETYCTLN